MGWSVFFKDLNNFLLNDFFTFFQNFYLKLLKLDGLNIRKNEQQKEVLKIIYI